MKNVFILIFVLVASISAFAQTNDLVIFSEKGEEFTLYVNSIQQNTTPAANVKAKDISGESFIARVVFVDKSIPELTQNFWTESKNVEISAVIKVNNKGKYVLRYMGENPKTAGSVAATTTNSQATYEDPGAPSNTSNNSGSTGNQTSVTTTTVTTERVPRETIDMNETVTTNVTANETGMTFTTTAGGETVDMNVTANENGMNFSTTAGGETVDMNVTADETGMNFTTTAGGETVTMDVNANENGMNFTTGAGGETISMNISVTGSESMGVVDYEETVTTTTTTTTSYEGTTITPSDNYSSSSSSSSSYSRCSYAMSDGDFKEALSSINSKSFEDSKLTTAKQICKSECMTAEQIRDINKAFGFEETRLEFAKFAYDYVYDASKYYKVNDSFSFEMTIEELDEYLQTK
jgi:hypothetical protein